MMNKQVSVTFVCKFCGCTFDKVDDEDIDELLWGHIQMRHEDVFDEVQDWETPYMIEECYDVEENL